MSELPVAVARHFADGVGSLDDPRWRSLAIGRLLEEGDRADLAWLAGAVGPAEITAWFDRHGERRLSRRSRALWSAALSRPLSERRAAAEALWPLA